MATPAAIGMLANSGLATWLPWSVLKISGRSCRASAAWLSGLTRR